MNISRCLRAIYSSSFDAHKRALAAIALICTLVSTNAFAALTIENYQSISVTRVSRVVYEMTFKASLVNTGSLEYSSAKAIVTPTVSNITVVDNDLLFATISGNSTLPSIDTFTIRVDRSVATPPLEEALSWAITPELKPPPVPTPSPAEAGIFMRAEGIQGEATSKTHKGWIPLLAAVEGSDLSGFDASGVGKVNFHDVMVVKYIDAASVPLRLALAEGDTLGEVVIEVVKSCGNTGKFYTQFAIEMRNVLVSNVSAGGSGGEDRLTENLALKFSQVVWTYVSTDSDCSKLSEEYGGWDVTENKPY